MKYFVILEDGRKFGPADIPTLNKWIEEKRLTPETMLESEVTGEQHKASMLPGLNFQAAAPAPQPDVFKSPDPVQQPTDQGQPGSSQSPYDYSQPPQPTAGYSRAPVQGYSEESQKLVTASWIKMIIGFFCCFLITIWGLTDAIKAKNMGNPNASAPVIVGWILLGLALLGIVLQVLFIAGGAAFGEF